MKTKLYLSLSLGLLIFSFLGFTPKTEKAGQVMIYGIVYTNACTSSETYQHYTYNLVNPEIYSKEMDKMKLELQQKYPNAKRIKVGSSKFDLGSSATNMCIIKWTNNNNKCSYDVLWIQFGITEQDALDRAIKHKKEWADSKANHSVLEQKYW